VIGDKDVPPGNILLIGGAGYIGRHLAFELIDNKRNVVILDNLSTGSPRYLPDCLILVEDIENIAFESLSSMRGQIAGVVHLAALTDAAESVKLPEAYLRTNINGAIRAMDLANYLGAKSFVFSSTAAVYGEPEYLPIDEAHPVKPVNPYGWSKLSAESCLKARAERYGIGLAILRYFNVAGADPLGRTGDMRKIGENVVHKLLEMLGPDDFSQFSIYGGDYDTPDGTPTRDYIHVTDLARAHIVALKAIERSPECSPLLANVGYGQPVSVKELFEAFKSCAGIRYDGCYRIERRRPGDIGQSYASAEIIRRLGWKPTHASLESILESAITWMEMKRAC
jgi:UDP-glucose 4-epimerase